MVLAMDDAAPYLDSLAEPRRGEIARLHALVRSALPELVYIQSAIGEEYLAPRYAARLSGASIGKSCVRIKRLDHVDLEVLAALLREAGEHPALGAVA